MEEQELFEVFHDYQDLIDNKEELGMSVLTSKKVDEHFEELGEALNTLIAYPDLFIDLIVPKNSKFELYFYQRIILRSFARYKQIYVTATRAASKSFLAFISRYLKCMQVPRTQTFVCMDIKKQAAEVTQEKVKDLWDKFPLFKKEMIKIPQPGGAPKAPFTSGQGYATLHFSDESDFEVMSVDSARGRRRTDGLIEEVIEQDAKKINEKIIPLMNVSRRTSRGEVLENEPHAAQLYVTTAGSSKKLGAPTYFTLYQAGYMYSYS